MPRDSGHAGPAVRQIDRGVKWALEQRSAERPVLVHCAHGHGRSLVLMCAILVVSGQVTLTAVGYLFRTCLHSSLLSLARGASLQLWMSPRLQCLCSGLCSLLFCGQGRFCTLLICA